MNKPVDDTQIAPAVTVKKSRWIDYMIGGSFIAAAGSGIVSAYNATKHNFMGAFVYGYSDNHPTSFKPLVNELRKERDAIEEKFVTREINAPEYYQQHKAWVKKNAHALQDAVDTTFEIKGTNSLTRWVNRTGFMAKCAGKTSLRSALLGIASSSAVAIGAVAVLKHSKNSSDRMNELVDRLNEREDRAQR